MTHKVIAIKDVMENVDPYSRTSQKNYIGCEIINIEKENYSNMKIIIFKGTHSECIDFAENNCTDCIENSF